jgi:predicted outer membrane protein
VIAASPQQQGNQNDPQQRPQFPNRTFQEGNRGLANQGMNGQQGALDHFITKVLIKANKDEIEMGKVAEQRSNNAEVKQLAQQMVQDHTRFLSQLEQVKGAGGMQRPTQGRAAFRGAPGDEGQTQQQQPGQQRPLNGQNQPFGQNQQLGNQNQQPGNLNEQGAGQPGINQQPGFAGQPRMGQRGHMMGGEHERFAKIMEQVDQQMQQAMMQDLNSKQGAAFDRCYLGAQLFGHMWVVQALKVFEQDASPQLKTILQEGLQTSEQHLTHIKSLMAKVDNEPAATGGLQQRDGRRLGRQ